MKFTRRKNNEEAGKIYTIFLGRAGSGKTFKGIAPILLNSQGSIIVNDFKCELLQKYKVELIEKGYKIKILDLCKLSQSNHYNPFEYIYDEDGSIRQAYIYDLAKCIVECFYKHKIKKLYPDKDPYFQQAEFFLLKAVIYFVAEKYKDEPSKKNFKTVLELINLLYVDDTKENKLDILFRNYKEKYGLDNMVIETYNYFDIAVVQYNSPIVRKRIKEELCLYLSVFNTDAIQDITCSYDTMELDRIGMPINQEELKKINDKSTKKRENGKIAYFINASPYNLPNCVLTSILYTQIFEQILENKVKCDNLYIQDTSVDILLDNFQDFIEVPEFMDFIFYWKHPNKKLYFCLQDLSWLKIHYSYWEELLDISTVIDMENHNKTKKTNFLKEFLQKKTSVKIKGVEY